MKVLKVAYYMTGVLSFLALAWMVGSWVDVVANNLNPDPVYKAWNLFVLMTGGIA